MKAAYRVVYENYRLDVQDSDRINETDNKSSKSFSRKDSENLSNWKSEALKTYIKLRVRDLTNEMIN